MACMWLVKIIERKDEPPTLWQPTWATAASTSESVRRLPWQPPGCGHRICIAMSLVKAPLEMSGFVRSGAGRVPTWNPAPHRRPSQAAWPDHSGLMSIATNKAVMNMRSMQKPR